MFFFFNDPAPTEIYTLSLHDALPISGVEPSPAPRVDTVLHNRRRVPEAQAGRPRSEEHTSELQSRGHLVCRLLLEKKKHKLEDYSAELRRPYADQHNVSYHTSLTMLP